MSEAFRYDFSVVSAVYNAAPYLREMIDSIIGQSVGFERTQLILVDDGSPDESGAICDEYAAQYPDNILVIHRENGGPSAARNAGIARAEGRYINFCDSDDKLSANAFEKVAAFFERFGDQTDVVTIPMFFFQEEHGPHWQNYKFQKGTRVINLWEEHTATNMTVSASFFPHRVKDQLRFDPRLVDSEDGKVAMGVMLNKMTLGVISNARYWYRRHNSTSISVVRASAHRKEWYLDYLCCYCDWAIEMAKARFGFVPDYVQHQLMCHLQWRFNSEDYSRECLDENERAAYFAKLRQVLRHIDDRIILEMRKLYTEHKALVLKFKHGRPADWLDTGVNLIPHFGATILPGLADRPVKLEFLTLTAAAVTVEGCVSLYAHPADCAFSVEALLDGVPVPTERVERPRLHQELDGETVMDGVGFRAELPAAQFREKGSHILSFRLCVGSSRFPVRKLTPGPFFPLSLTLRSASYQAAGIMVTYASGRLTITQRPGLGERMRREYRFLKEVWKKNALGGRKAVFGRIAYRLLRPLRRRRIWLLSDRVNKADDNGEALFTYLSAHPVKGVHPIFAINKTAPDYARMKALGTVVDAMSFRHKMLHLLADMVLSSSGDNTTVNPFWGHHDALRDLLQTQRYVFLQHGVTKDDISDWVNRYNKNMTGFVVSANAEYDSILACDYSYGPAQVWLTGMPRFDRLYHQEEKIITLMPTWRRYLMDHVDHKTGLWVPRGGFEDSAYYQFYHQLQTDERLLAALKKYGYTMQLFAHPNVHQLMIPDPVPEGVEALPLTTAYRDMYARSSLILTDYSSAVFDFAYLRKPVVYAQFDREEFFGGDHVYTKGYFDYDRDGFGEVTFDLASTVDTLIDYMKNGCQLKEEYRERIDRFFAFNDQNCCQRVVERVLALDKEGQG